LLLLLGDEAFYLHPTEHRLLALFGVFGVAADR